MMLKIGSLRHLVLLSIQLLIVVALVSDARCEFANEDEPECVEHCTSVESVEAQVACREKYLKFYSYKMVKSLFNFAKLSIFAGLWDYRYEHADPMLFESVLMSSLASYNSSKLLGNTRFEALNRTIGEIYGKLKYLTHKQEKEIPYKSYPSLKCPIPCSYELVTWQTLFGISVGIFFLSLVTISLYSIFLRRQYISLTNRIKSIKYTPANRAES